MTVNWWTIGLQTANFLVLVWLLYRLLYRPVREAIENRKALAMQAIGEADRAKTEAEAAKTRYENDGKRLAGENDEKLRLLHREAEAERAKIVAAAHGEAQRLVDAAHTTITEERKAALKDLREQALSLAAELAADLLAKIAPAQSSDAFLAALVKRLEEAPPDERARLQRNLAEKGTALGVATAVPLSAQDQERWRTRFAQLLGHTGDVRFVTDSALVGGAELRFPHAVLGVTWRDQLETAKRNLGHDRQAS